MNLLLAGALVGALLQPAPPPHAIWPLAPRPEVLARFEQPAHTWSAGHRGVDLVGAAGSMVRAPLRGTVLFSGTIAGRGVVVIGHGRSRTTYEPVLSELRPGAVVAAGETIGTLQAGGGHCLPRTCLHWGLIEDGHYADPLGLLGQGRVRLLPLEGSGTPDARP